MVTARLAIGSVSTLALGALLLGSAPYWLSRHGTGAHAAPWGDVSALGIGASTATPSADDRAQLLKLAALKSGATAEAPAMLAAPVPQADPTPVVQQASAPSDPVPVLPAVMTDAPGVPAQPAAEATAPQQVASAEEPAAAIADDDAAKADRININTASTNALDHLPGAGRIGHTIVSHRPYKSVKDLVSRRILRMSDFQKIQGRIGVD